ncbi:MAG: glycosyltransferase family 1 protein [Chitinophagaceae bacterium]
MRVTFVNRKPLNGYFSIENVFKALIPSFPVDINIDNFYVKSSRAYPLGIFKNLFYRAKKADIYHVTGDIHYAVFSYPRNKTVLTIHDCRFMMSKSLLKRFLMKWIWLKLPVKKAKFVTVISEKSKRDVVKYTGCNPKKIAVIPDPLAPHFKYTRKVFNSERPRILQVGTAFNKNLHRVIEALGGISCEFTILGRLSEADINYLKKFKIIYRNRWDLSDEDIASEYRNSDIVVFASVFEGFGLPIIEAQASGRIVVTSNISPLIEVSGGLASFVNPFDVNSIKEGILEMINNSEKRNRLIESGLENAKRYNPTIIARSYYEIYKKIFFSGNSSSFNL